MLAIDKWEAVAKITYHAGNGEKKTPTDDSKRDKLGNEDLVEPEMTWVSEAKRRASR